MSSSMAVRIVGRAPLLMRSGRLADPLDDVAKALARLTCKRLKTESDHNRIAAIEWRGALWLSEGRPCIPGEAIESAVTAAARTRRMGAVVRAAVIVPNHAVLDHDGPEDLDIMYRDPRFVHRCGVRVAGRTSMRTRPQFPQWSAVIRLDYLDTMIDGEALRDLVVIAGDRIGVGDYRPKYGRFSVEAI